MKTTTLTVSGMHCQGCATSVQKALSSVNGVKDVNVDLDSGVATVFHDPIVVSEPKLVEAVEDAGFEANYQL